MKNKYELINLKTDKIVLKTYSPYKIAMYIANNISPEVVDSYIVVISRDDYILATITAINYMVFTQDFLEDIIHKKFL